MKFRLFILIFLLIIQSVQAENVSFTGCVKTMQSVPINHYWVFFRFSAPAYLPGDFSMNGPVIQTGTNGQYTFTLYNVPSDIEYHAKIYVYNSSLQRVEKSFSFYATGYNYIVPTIYANPISQTNNWVNYTHSNNCPDCPAMKTLTNTSSFSLTNSPIALWEWSAVNSVFSSSLTTPFFVATPDHQIVKLKVSLKDPYTNFVFFKDSATKDIITDNNFFFNMGGQIFADEMPVSTAGVILYRNNCGNYKMMDTMIVDMYGYYYFTDLPSCSYIIKAFPDPEQIKSEYYLPTYFPGTCTWQQASIINNTNTSSTLSYFLQGSSIASGDGSIIGSVKSPENNPVENCEIVLLDNNMAALHYSITNNQGNYQFPDLPNGQYIVLYDIPGIVPQPVQITIYDLNPNQEVHFVVGLPANVEENLIFPDLVVFPNPCSNLVNISLPIEIAGSVNIIIRNNNGSIVMFFQNEPTDHQITVQTANLSDGLYLLQIIAPSYNAQTTLIKISD